MQNISEMLAKTFKENRRLEGFFLAARITAVWQTIGATFQNDFRIVNFSEGVITLAGENNLYLYHLKQMKKNLIEAFNRELGAETVTDIHFKICRLNDSQAEQRDSWLEYQAGHPLTGEILDEINALLSDIESNELRKNFKSYLGNAWLYERYLNEK
ncbi:MAG: DUF721 domain-containing protein [Candidatus Wallbacteria bacterium]|nr:DUF721 domain-containing protein [Candidatus Wallbacteria bacterium]